MQILSNLDDVEYMVFLINAHDLHELFSPYLLQPRSRKIISPKIKKSVGRMAPGVRNSKRVRASTQSDVQPFESETRASKRLIVQDPTAPYDDNPAAEESNGPAVDENTPSEDGSVSAGHDNTALEAHIGVANDDNTLAEGKHFFSCSFDIYLVDFAAIK
jgi:hypothetical protein